jgi:hypothetical protein
MLLSGAVLTRLVEAVVCGDRRQRRGQFAPQMGRDAYGNG